MKKMLSGLAAALAIVMLCAWGSDTATLMFNPTTKQCNSDIDMAGTFKVGGVTLTAAKVTELAASASANTASTLVKRDSSGNFSAGTITASLTGNCSGSSGSCTGNAATATLAATITAADTTDTSCSIAMFESATGNMAIKTDAGLSYNAGTGMLTATGFTGPLTGAASANPTISTGTAAPTTTPTKVGDLFIDTSSHKLYFADMTSDSTGWVIAN